MMEPNASPRGFWRVAILVALALSGSPARAQPVSPGQPLPASPEAGEAQPSGQGGARPTEKPTGLWERDQLLGTIGGLRPALDRYGISLGLTEQSEVLGNPAGGRRRGVIYEGATEMSLGADLGKALGWNGATFNVSAWQIHGRGLSLNDLDNLNTVSGIEADRSTRLFELWLEQSLFGGALSVRVGQQSADLEFMISQYGTLFVNGSFGWATLPSADLPSDGPSYPLATPGVRVRIRPSDRVAVLVAAYNGNPAGPGPDSGPLSDPQRRDASGTLFRVGDGVTAIGEVEVALGEKDGRPGMLKLGGWYNSNDFPDQRLGPARMRRNDWSLYGVLDQLVWRPARAKEGGVGVFARLMGAPGDRNLISVFAQGGVTWKGLIPGRGDDTAGLGFAYARIGEGARRADSDMARTSGTPYPLRTGEALIELTYQAQIAPWWQVQPDVQYVINPGGTIPNPDRPSRKLGDTAVVGVRTTVTF